MGFKNQNHDLFVQKGSIHDLYVHTSPAFGKFLHSCQPLVMRKQRSKYEREKLKKRKDLGKHGRKEASGRVHNDSWKRIEKTCKKHIEKRIKRGTYCSLLAR
jgi:hypothetical protein